MFQFHSLNTTSEWDRSDWWTWTWDWTWLPTDQPVRQSYVLGWTFTLCTNWHVKSPTRSAGTHKIYIASAAAAACYCCCRRLLQMNRLKHSNRCKHVWLHNNNNIMQQMHSYSTKLQFKCDGPHYVIEWRTASARTQYSFASGEWESVTEIDGFGVALWYTAFSSFQSKLRSFMHHVHRAHKLQRIDSAWRPKHQKWIASKCIDS